MLVVLEIRHQLDLPVNKNININIIRSYKYNKGQRKQKCQHMDEDIQVQM